MPFCLNIWCFLVLVSGFAFPRRFRSVGFLPTSRCPPFLNDQRLFPRSGILTHSHTHTLTRLMSVQLAFVDTVRWCVVSLRYFASNPLPICYNKSIAPPPPLTDKLYTYVRVQISDPDLVTVGDGSTINEHADLSGHQVRWHQMIMITWHEVLYVLRSMYVLRATSPPLHGGIS